MEVNDCQLTAVGDSLDLPRLTTTPATDDETTRSRTIGQRVMIMDKQAGWGPSGGLNIWDGFSNRGRRLVPSVEAQRAFVYFRGRLG